MRYRIKRHPSGRGFAIYKPDGFNAWLGRRRYWQSIELAMTAALDSFKKEQTRKHHDRSF